MDTDTAMEFSTLQVAAQSAPPQGLARNIIPPQGPTRNVPPQGPAKEITAPDLVSHLTKAMASAAVEVIDGLARPPLVTDATDAALQERFMQRRTTAQHSSTTPAATGRVSVFDQLAHRQQSPMKEDTWQPHPEMMPWKITERGHQPERSQEPARSTSQVAQESGWSTSQKRHSQSHPQDKGDSKKGRMEDGTTQGRKVQVGIDWANTGIQKLVPKPDPNTLHLDQTHLGLQTVCPHPRLSLQSLLGGHSGHRERVIQQDTIRHQPHKKARPAKWKPTRWKLRVPGWVLPSTRVTLKNSPIRG